VHTIWQYDTAIELHEQSRAISEELGDRAGVGRACCNLGLCYESLRQFDTAIGLLEKAKTILQEMFQRADEAKAWAALGRCKTALGEYAQAITCHTEQWSLVQQLDLKHDQTKAALDRGVAMWAKVRVEHRNVADVVDVAAFPERPSASNCPAAYMNSMCDAEQWLVTALGLAGTHGFGFEKDDARLHLSFLAFDTEREQDAIYHLQQHLHAQVGIGRFLCRGCGQNRGEDAPMLTCGGCSVARFCNETRQQIASKRGDQHRKAVRHKDLCPLLKKWRHVATGKGKATALACTPDPSLLEFSDKIRGGSSNPYQVIPGGACDKPKEDVYTVGLCRWGESARAMGGCKVPLKKEDSANVFVFLFNARGYICTFVVRAGVRMSGVCVFKFVHVFVCVSLWRAYQHSHKTVTQQLEQVGQTRISVLRYVVATVSRIDKIIGLLCKRAL